MRVIIVSLLINTTVVLNKLFLWSCLSPNKKDTKQIFIAEQDIFIIYDSVYSLEYRKKEIDIDQIYTVSNSLKEQDVQCHQYYNNIHGFQEDDSGLRDTLVS